MTDTDGDAPAVLIVKTFVPTTARWLIGTARRPIWLRIDDRPIRLDRDVDLRIELPAGTHTLTAAPSSGVTETPTPRQWARSSESLETHLGAGQTAVVVVISTHLGLKIGSLVRCRRP
ncbi:hypothetical protein AXK56_17595 [Tsukamurella pulmonis]|uniref:Uncharacterized protein n=1 Tax=Tsukamurella pulmonis TaxID=47312 RepID=A0A1H1HRS0_9ACTN|nr:hypothetical protein [Tsukamurella pulmonis]KXO94463.1 hypothetical protein AXK56_17595 [Tsukamurella pulmonis]SDR27798.1 hypothetical protein SAMN04489765_4484 [Tsukamurella pulmonis]SUP13572.1 Uncharacterised protein [Tsukamurella pulmonis]